MIDDEERCRDSGCDGYLSKPISIRDLLQTIERFLDQPVPQASAIG
jgi:CheY-like chemotaxis protein